MKRTVERIERLEAKMNGGKKELRIVTRVNQDGEESVHVEDVSEWQFDPRILRIWRPMTEEREKELFEKLSDEDKRKWLEWSGRDFRSTY